MAVEGLQWKNLVWQLIRLTETGKLYAVMCWQKCMVCGGRGEDCSFLQHLTDSKIWLLLIT